MRIGFDAKRAFSNYTGLGNYSRDTIRALEEFYPKNQYFLFTPKFTENKRLDFIEGKTTFTPFVLKIFLTRFFHHIGERRILFNKSKTIKLIFIMV